MQYDQLRECVYQMRENEAMTSEKITVWAANEASEGMVIDHLLGRYDCGFGGVSFSEEEFRNKWKGDCHKFTVNIEVSHEA